MIKVDAKSMCCGCAACVQRCPKQCIVMEADSEGFLYPLVDTDKCIDCGLCEKVCPMLNSGEERVPLHTYAARCTPCQIAGLKRFLRREYDNLLADLWGAQQIIGTDDDDKGVSLVAVDNEALLPTDKLWLREIEYSEAVKYNSSIVKSVLWNKKREEFFVKFANGESIASIVGELTRLPLAQRAVGFLKRVVKKIIGRK